MGHFAEEFVTRFFTRDLQVPMREIRRVIATVSAALEHQEIRGGGYDIRFEESRSGCDLSLKAKLFVQRRPKALVAIVVDIDFENQHFGRHG